MIRQIKLALILMALVVASAAVSAGAASVTSESPLSTAGVGKSEVSLGDLVADALRRVFDAEMAFVSASELKERDVQIPKGKVDASDITPFVAYTDDPIVLMQLTGAKIKQALERSVLIYPQKNLGFLQVSGLRFTFDPSKPQESRVTSVLVGERGNTQISDSETYTVAMTSSMANGALGYWKIWSKNDKVRDSSTTIPQAVENFFDGRKSINYSNLNRINER